MAASSPEKNTSPFASRGLEQHATIDLLREGMVASQGIVLERAAAIGLNRAYMGERWPDLGVRLVDYRETFPQLVTPERTDDTARRRETFRQICAQAKSLGIEPWVNLNILNYPDNFTTLFPDAIATAPLTADRWMRGKGARGLAKQPQLCASSTSFKRLVEAQLTELCRLPDIVGIECWLTAADTDMFYCACEVCRKKSIAEMIVEFAAYAHPVCLRHGKKLLLRCYLGGWRCALEADVWPEAAPLIPSEIEICYKQQNGDLMNWHGPNTMAGLLKPHPEHAEFDLAGEYRGTNYGMVCTVRWQMQELLQHFLKKGVTGVACRGVDTIHPFDLDKWIFGALIQNPNLDVKAWSSEWAAERYGEAGDEVLAVLDECAEIMRLAMYVQGVQWASWAVPQNLARLRFILFDRCAGCVPGSYERLQPTPANIAAIIQEKELALQKANLLVDRCARLQGRLADEFFAPLDASVRYLRAYTSITGPLMESVFRFLAWSQSFSEAAREYIRIPLLSSIEAGNQQLAKILAEVETMDLKSLILVTSHAGFVDAGSLDKFREPFNNASVVLREIRQLIETESASWWAYYPSPDRWPEKFRAGLEIYEAAGPA
jgi:hypothetical protein